MTINDRIIKRALVSVTDKSELAAIVDLLHRNGVEIISTGGTKTFIENLKIPVTSIESVTGNPEAFGGRMKSISFQVASALLFRRNHEGDLKEAKELNITPIDLVICNLYPFSEYAGTFASEEVLIENIDIGGPLMLRASAKNYNSVTVLSSIADYDQFKEEFLSNNGEISFESRRNFAIKTFNRIAEYDILIAEELNDRFLSQKIQKSFLSIAEKGKLRYGENPHQSATLYKIKNNNGNSLIDAEFIQGKELSYNNWMDSDAAWRVMSDVANAFKENKISVVAIIKHANPCGLAVSHSSITALKEAWEGDSISSFGGILAFSSIVDYEVAKFLDEKFIEVVIAPEFTNEALELFSKKKNLRILKTQIRSPNQNETIFKSISGGLLSQNEDEYQIESLKEVTKLKFTDAQNALAQFGIIACKHLKSNGIALVYKTVEGNFTLAGAGMGQPNRLDSLRFLAQKRANDKGLPMKELLLVSDAFFPFADSIEVCHEVGIKAIIQPGGSIRDSEVINACDNFEIAMAFSGVRHFRH